ncbi:MAG: hypothetical protein ACOYLX_09935 [Burkholderiaceae bacterium]
MTPAALPARRPRRMPLVGLLLVAALVPAVSAASTAVDIGELSVLSQRGQKLKLVVPYGSAPGERVSVTRFEVVSVEAPTGFRAPDPAGFSFAKPERRNLVILQSREPIDAPRLLVTVRVVDQPDSEQTFRVAVPPARASAAPTGAVASPMAMPVSLRAERAPRAARRTPAAVPAPIADPTR